MPIQPRGNPLFFLGFVQWGDIAELTTYRRPDGRVVLFAKTYPDKPPSPAQIAVRTHFLAAATRWRSLLPAERGQWNLAARRASLCMSGRNLHCAAYLNPDPAALATIARQTHTTLTV
jgi:hypothetical protein